MGDVNQLIDDYLKVKDDLEAIPADELVDRANLGLIIVLDVRPPEEYAASHLPGALNIPLSQLENKLNELDQGKEIVAYCRGPYCVLAYDAIEKLRSKGMNARRLKGGFPEWKLQGLPTEQSK